MLATVPDEFKVPLIRAGLERVAIGTVQQIRPMEGKAFYLDLLEPADYDVGSPFMAYALSAIRLLFCSLCLMLAADVSA